jgi:hypothetical protein
MFQEKLLHLTQRVICKPEVDGGHESHNTGKRSCMMKKTGILTMIVSILIVAFCMNVYAQQISAQVSALEKRADRIQSQIDQAKKHSAASMDQQVQALKTSLGHLMQQRVRVDAQIAKLESQIEGLQSSTNSVLTRQIGHYSNELAKVKQQISSLMAKEKEAAKAAQKPPVAPQPAVIQKVPAPAATKPAAKAAPTAQKKSPASAAKECPSCPKQPAAKVLPGPKARLTADSRPAAVTVTPKSLKQSAKAISTKMAQPKAVIQAKAVHAKKNVPAAAMKNVPAKSGVEAPAAR